MIERRHAAALAFVALGAASLLAQDGQWLMYSGSYDSHRFSPLTQITAANVARLRPVWAYQPPGTGSIESTPI
ncbi:MAG: PQQ-dependent dehydrogenase, methanol/ethanol family, partial [Acidobacteria bacterium]